MVHLAQYATMRKQNSKIVEVFFYKTPGGKEPVREWMLHLDKDDRYIIGVDLKTVEFGWPLGMPLVRSVKSHDRLWEVRSNISGNRIARVLFTVHDARMVLLHGFIKKTQKTSKSDLDLADDLKRVVNRGN
jgi:phage-related protein